jgi:hypothetical protein
VRRGIVAALLVTLSTDPDLAAGARSRLLAMMAASVAATS